MTGKPSLAQRASTVWRSGGVSGLVRGALRRVGEVRSVLLLAARAVGDDDGTAEPPSALGFEWVGVETFDRVLATPGFQFPPAAARRARQWLARGDRCLLGHVDDQPATYLWVGTTVREFPGTACPIGPGKAYVYKTFTLPEFRGRGLNTAALREVRRRCGSEGFREVLIDVASNNAASRRAIERAGFVLTGQFVVLRLGGRRRTWLTGSVRRRISGAAGA